MPTPAKEKIIIGRFGAPFGIKGWVKVISYGNPPEQIFSYKHWYIEEKPNTWVKVKIEDAKLHGNVLLTKLPECDDRDQAQLYTNKQIAITENQLAPLAANEFYWSDLEGLVVFNQQQQELGIVQRVIATGANDVLIVRQDKKERLIPFIKNVIIKVDLEKKRIDVDWDSEW